MAPRKKITIVDLIKEIINDELRLTHTAIPAIVQTFNVDQKIVDVIPAIKRQYEDCEIVQLPLIKDVPIAYPQASNFALAFPLEKDDPVLLVFSERSIEQWKNRGGILDPGDVRKHDMSDAIAYPGINKLSTGLKPEAGKVKIQYHNGIISIDNSSEIRVENDQGNMELDNTGKWSFNDGDVTIEKI